MEWDDEDDDTIPEASDVEIVDAVPPKKKSDLAAACLSSDDDSFTVDPKPDEPNEAQLEGNSPFGSLMAHLAPHVDTFSPIWLHSALKTPAKKRKEHPDDDKTPPSTVSHVWAEPCKHWKVNTLHFEMVEDDRYFDPKNKVYKQPCIVCGDLLVHGKKAAKDVCDELYCIQTQQKDLTAALDDAAKGKCIFKLIWFGHGPFCASFGVFCSFVCRR